MARKREYRGQDITITFDARRCIHAQECVKGLPDVFDADARPWVSADGAGADAVAEVVHSCPSGALSYRRHDSGPAEAPDRPPRIELVRDGPIYVRGDLALVDHDGTPVATPPRAALCRCGASKNKPFCDNSHREIGFRSEEES